ncbi:hypothetical protein L195_g040412, partial [Trifolium pratense]
MQVPPTGEHCSRHCLLYVSDESVSSEALQLYKVDVGTVELIQDVPLSSVSDKWGYGCRIKKVYFCVCGGRCLIGMCMFDLVWRIAGCSVSVLLALSVGACPVAVLPFALHFNGSNEDSIVELLSCLECDFLIYKK